MDLQIALVRQSLSNTRIDNVSTAVQAGLQDLPLSAVIRPDMNVAIGLGSRGISCLPEVVITVVEELRKLGARPFIVPAMGSHGGGTAAGQMEVLESYGVGANQLKIEIRASMEVVQLGETPLGMPVFCAAEAARADAVVLINRIKEHTAFKAPLESGLMKILSVGLGKARGAAEIHNWGVAEAMPAAAQVLLDKLPVVVGIGIVENGYHAPARIIVLPGQQIPVEEPMLLDEARKLAPKIPLEPLDLLVLQQIGKDISGTGMDLNVVGMWRRTGGPVNPEFSIIGVLDLTAFSHGNAIGMGHADLITRRLLDKVDLHATYLNCLTSKNLAGAKIPITLESDQVLFETALAGLDPRKARVVIARNTLELDYFWVSSSMLEEVEKHPDLEQVEPLRPLCFDADGLLILPPESEIRAANGGVGAHA
jgi:hypothetical protein